MFGWDPTRLRDDPATASAFAAGMLLSPEEAVELASRWLADRAAAGPSSP